MWGCVPTRISGAPHPRPTPFVGLLAEDLAGRPAITSVLVFLEAIDISKVHLDLSYYSHWFCYDIGSCQYNQ